MTSISIDLRNKIIDKAKRKKNGVYSLSGWLYAVKDSNLIAFAKFGCVFQCVGVFNTQIAEVEPHESRGILIRMIK